MKILNWFKGLFLKKNKEKEVVEEYKYPNVVTNSEEHFKEVFDLRVKSRDSGNRKVQKSRVTSEDNIIDDIIDVAVSSYLIDSVFDSSSNSSDYSSSSNDSSGFDSGGGDFGGGGSSDSW